MELEWGECLGLSGIWTSLNGVLLFFWSNYVSFALWMPLSSSSFWFLVSADFYGFPWYSHIALPKGHRHCIQKGASCNKTWNCFKDTGKYQMVLPKLSWSRQVFSALFHLKWISSWAVGVKTSSSSVANTILFRPRLCVCAV